jgi:hypothetical protein
VFLDWLAARQHILRTCEQANIDKRHAEHPRNRLRGFLLWGMASKLTRPLRLPAPAIARNAPLPQRERMALLGQLLTGHDLPPRSQVAHRHPPAPPGHASARHSGRPQLSPCDRSQGRLTRRCELEPLRRWSPHKN